jgi:quercetin dioxygenase-like cupin family protein
MQITRSSIDTVKGPEDWFTGDVCIDAMAAAPPPSRLTANLVHFMPGARTHWHRHPLSQSVFVTEGIGLCQRRSGPVEVIRSGDRVLFEADEEHWHGAAPNRLMVHVAINEGDDQHDVVHWLEPVTDDDYAAVPGSDGLNVAITSDLATNTECLYGVVQLEHRGKSGRRGERAAIWRRYEAALLPCRACVQPTVPPSSAAAE